MISETIAKLRLRRERLDMKPEVLAAALEISTVTLWKYENGRAKKIRKSMMTEWDRVLKLAEERKREANRRIV